MELSELRSYIAVVEAGSFSAAARKLHLSQPALSLTVRRMETELGVALLSRSVRGVEPTAAGQFLMTAAARLIGDADEIRSELRRFGAGSAGALTIAAVPALMWSKVPKLLARFSAVAPDVSVSLIDPPPWTALDLLEQRRVDVALALVQQPSQFARRTRDRFDVVDWGAAEIVAVMAEDVEVPDVVPLDEFERVPVVLPRRAPAVPSLPESVDSTFAAHGIIPGQLRSTETFQTALPLIEAGLAWGLLPDADGDGLRRFRVKSRPVSPAIEPLRAVAVVRKGGPENPAVGALLNSLHSDTETGNEAQ